jgi:hypothetical protein
MKVLWQLPCPSTAFLEGVEFRVLPSRAAELLFRYEVEQDIIEGKLIFQGIEAYKCSYLTACSEYMIRSSYDKLVDCGNSEWLRAVNEVSKSISIRSKELRHFMITFDDGPCFEFICEHFGT